MIILNAVLLVSRSVVNVCLEWTLVHYTDLLGDPKNIKKHQKYEKHDIIKCSNQTSSLNASKHYISYRMKLQRENPFISVCVLWIIFATNQYSRKNGDKQEKSG